MVLPARAVMSVKVPMLCGGMKGFEVQNALRCVEVKRVLRPYKWVAMWKKIYAGAQGKQSKSR